MSRNPVVTVVNSSLDSSDECGTTPVARPAIPTWALFTAIALVLILTNWYSQNFVVTREVQEILLRTRMDATAFDRYWKRMRWARTFSYVLEPVGLLVQLGFVAFLAQCFLLSVQREVRFGALFRAAAWAHVVQLVAVVAQIVYRSGLSTDEISSATFYRSVGTLADLVPGSMGWPGPIRSVLVLVTVFELVWIAALVTAFRRSVGLPRGYAIATGAVLLVSLNVLQWTAIVFVASFTQ